jgi:hypothetical protein
VTADGDLTLFDPEDVPGMSNPATGIRDPGISLSCPPGQETPRNGHVVPQVAGRGLPYAFDWSVGRGITAVDPQGFTIGTRSLSELIRVVPHGATVVGESTFESYDRSLREQVIQLAESRDVTLLTVPARGNTWRRAAAGMPEKTGQSRQTDREDALAIQRAAVNGAHLKKPSILDPAWAALRDRAAARFVYLRCSGQKDTYARERMARLPHFTWQPDERRIALGPSGGYNAVIVAAVAVAAEFVTDRRAFERLTGLYAHGYPSQFRSDLMHWGWGRRPEKRERIRLTVYRRELRWLFAQFKQPGAQAI